LAGFFSGANELTFFGGSGLNGSGSRLGDAVEIGFSHVRGLLNGFLH
jgi:hypothetical protein